MRNKNTLYSQEPIVETPAKSLNGNSHERARAKSSNIKPQHGARKHYVYKNIKILATRVRFASNTKANITAMHFRYEPAHILCGIFWHFLADFFRFNFSSVCEWCA